MRVTGRLKDFGTSERGLAMPVAMVSLVILSAFVITFAILGKSDPTIAANQMQTAQALRLADSGLQLALWGLTNSTDPSGLGVNLAALAHDGTAAGGNYNGANFVTVGATGGFTVRVAWEPSNARYERSVTAVGWTPSKDAGFTNSHRKIQAVVQMGVIPPLDPPCVLCVAGEALVNGSAASFNTSIGGCPGTNPPRYAVQTVQPLQYNANPSFLGYGTRGPGAITQTNDTSQFKYTPDVLAKIKLIAQANGTYYQGAVSSLPASGIVYIDTMDGTPFSGLTPPGRDGSLNLSGNGTFNGIVIVNGSVNITGTRIINGLVYGLNDLTVSGNVVVNGAMVSENRRDTSSTNVDTDFAGNVTLNYNCNNIRGLPFVSTNWVVKDGAYLEQEGAN